VRRNDSNKATSMGRERHAFPSRAPKALGAPRTLRASGYDGPCGYCEYQRNPCGYCEYQGNPYGYCEYQGNPCGYCEYQGNPYGYCEYQGNWGSLGPAQLDLLDADDAIARPALLLEEGVEMR
jgi:hypothetical protein